VGTPYRNPRPIAEIEVSRDYPGMSNSASLFVPVSDDFDAAAMVAAAIECVEAFMECFNARDFEGMDARLHFPHLILFGEQLVVWERPGQFAFDVF
jgi:hypothetical protein